MTNDVLIQDDTADWDDASEAEESGPLLPRRPVRDSGDMDITPMIDITFLLLIFFLVASTADNATSVDLPAARFGEGVSERTSVIVTIDRPDGAGPAKVYLGDGTSGDLLPDDPELQAAGITELVQQGMNEGKQTVLIKGAKGIRHRDAIRVAAAAKRVEGVSIRFGVFEID